MRRGCPLNEEGNKCHAQLDELFTRTQLDFKEIGGMCFGHHELQHRPDH